MGAGGGGGPAAAPDGPAWSGGGAAALIVASELAGPLVERDQLAGHAVEGPPDHAAALDYCRPVVRGQDEARVLDSPADGRLLLALAAGVVAGDGRIELHALQMRRHQLELDVVDHVTADDREALVRVDEHVHGTFCMPAGVLAADTGDDLLRIDVLEVEQAKRGTLVVQAVDEVLDVGRRVLLTHQARHGVLELGTVDDDGRVQREVLVVARVIDVQMRMQDVADVLHLEAVSVERLLHSLTVPPPPLHPQVPHDLGLAEAGVDDDRRLASGDEEPERRHLLAPARVLREHKEARVERDIAQVEDVHFQTHVSSLGWMIGDHRGSQPAQPLPLAGYALIVTITRSL